MALYKGQGGATFEVTPPSEGTPQREQFDRQTASGELVLVDDAPAPSRSLVGDGEQVVATEGPEKPKRAPRKAQG